MTTMTAVVQAKGAVLLTINDAPAGDVQITRYDSNGFKNVRRPAVSNLTTGAVRTLVDYEAAVTGTVRYVLVDAAGGQARVSTNLTGTVTGPQLRRVFQPDVFVEPSVVLGMDASRALRYTRHTPVNRSDDVYTTYRQGLRTGSMRIRATSFAAVKGLSDLYGNGQPVNLRVPDIDHRGIDMIHLGLAVTPAAAEVIDGAQVWTVSVTYAEVDPGTASTLSRWTCQDVLDTYATAAVAGIPYTSLADFTLGREGVPL